MGGVEGCTKCIKYLLFFFNFVFWDLTNTTIDVFALCVRRGSGWLQLAKHLNARRSVQGEPTGTMLQRAGPHRDP
ncbi:unnamed protein product [Boreogadus saida]